MVRCPAPHADRAAQRTAREPGVAVLSDGVAPVDGRCFDVIVIGAGLAGLRCAHDLVAAGREVTVLEARPRVGGRVRSHRFTNGQWCELGAEFIDAGHVEVLALAASLGLALSSVPSGRDDTIRLLDVAGRTAPFAMHHSLSADLAAWDDALLSLSSAVDPDDVAATPDAARLDATPLSALLEPLHLGIMARVVIGRDVRTEYMLGPDEVSQLMAGWMTALHRRSGDGFEGHRIVGGNDQLATGLAASLGDRVCLATPVSSIDPDEGLIVLHSGQHLTADHIVAAVPLPVLGRMWPAMPPELAAAGYGIGGKVCIQIARRLWHDHGSDASVRTERAWGEVWETTDDQPGDPGVLTALLSSHDGAALLALPGTVDRILAELDRIYPGLRGLAGEHVTADWTNDPFSLGAYVTFGPGQLLAALGHLRRPVGRLVLAGEHTDAWAGYMEGALRSGARAARVIAGS